MRIELHYQHTFLFHNLLCLFVSNHTNRFRHLLYTLLRIFHSNISLFGLHWQHIKVGHLQFYHKLPFSMTLQYQLFQEDNQENKYSTQPHGTMVYIQDKTKVNFAHILKGCLIRINLIQCIQFLYRKQQVLSNEHQYQ